MATSYISSSQKDYINGIFDDVFETFARYITVIMNPEMVVATTSSTYNGFYGADTNSAVNEPTYTSKSYTFKAKISYVSNQKSIYPAAVNQQRMMYPEGTVKIKVGTDAFPYLKEAKKIEFDDRRYDIVSDYKPNGIFGPRYYSFVLTPINE